MHLTDITKSERGSTSGSGTAKQKEPNTPDLGSEGASAPVQKWVKIEGATYWHGSAPSIHVGASLQDVLEREEDDNYEKDGKERDEEFKEDVNQGGTPKDEGTGRRRMIRMMPNLSTLTPPLPNIGLRASRLNRMNRSPLW